jgi:hypothetical protein
MVVLFSLIKFLSLQLRQESFTCYRRRLEMYIKKIKIFYACTLIDLHNSNHLSLNTNSIILLHINYILNNNRGHISAIPQICPLTWNANLFEMPNIFLKRKQ